MDGQFARIVMAASEAFYLTRTGFAYMKKAMTDRNHLIERMMCIPKIGLEPVEWPPVETSGRLSVWQVAIGRSSVVSMQSLPHTILLRRWLFESGQGGECCRIQCVFVYVFVRFILKTLRKAFRLYVQDFPLNVLGRCVSCNKWPVFFTH